MYCETQSGILCRKHAINAYFGFEKITEAQFYKFQNDYDALYRNKFNVYLSCKDFDIVSSDQNNLVSYILKQNKIYTRYFALNELINGFDFNILDGDFFFIYNESHIYGARKQNELWYTINSIGGVAPVNINNIIHQKNIGFIVPTNHVKEFYRNLEIIKNIFNKPYTIMQIKSYLIEKNKDKLILGDLEVPLAICIDILEFQIEFKKDNIFNPIEEIINNYTEFIIMFTNKRYLDIELILKYLPDIILKLILLR